MTAISARDAASLLEIVHEGATEEGLESFPSRILLALAELIPSDACVGYQEAHVAGTFRVLDCVKVVGTDPSPRVQDAFHEFGWQNPMHCRLHARTDQVLRLSDLLTPRERLKLAYNAIVWRTYGIDDALRVWLPAPAGRAHSIYLERGGRPYSDRERTLLEILRPHLVRMQINAASRRRMHSDDRLTAREAEVLGWVARGATNAAIAAALFISPLTVRKHLENIFEKLNVRTRTAAAAHTRGSPEVGSARD